MAPLIAPAVDLSILGLLLATRYLALHGASVEDLRPLRRFTLFVSAVSLTLNVAEPVLSGDYGKAAFDAVGPMLLIGWAEIGPQVLHALARIEVPATLSGIAGLGSSVHVTQAGVSWAAAARTRGLKRPCL